MTTTTDISAGTAGEGLVQPAVVDVADGAVAVERLLACVRESRGGCVVLVGGPRSGKTALLRDSVDEASDMRRVRVSGIESERRFAYAAVHQLIVPFLVRLQRLPPPQREMLSALAGLAKAPSLDRFLVGLAVLTLLVDASGDQPVLVAVDDAQWLDRQSAEVLAFVARRVRAHRLAFVVTTLESEAGRTPFAHPPDKRPARPAPRAADMPRPVSPACPILPWLASSFAGRMRELPTSVQRMLLVAAVEPSGSSLGLRRAADRLGLSAEVVTAAEATGLVRIDDEGVGFSHPAIRSAIYHHAMAEERERIGAAISGAARAGPATRVLARSRGQAPAVPGYPTTSLRDGLALRGSEGFQAAVSILRAAVAAVLARDGVGDDAELDVFALGTVAAGDLLDADAQRSLAHRWVQVARDLGDGNALAAALGALARTEILAGRLDAAEACLGDVGVLAPHQRAGWPARGAELTVMAWRGREAEADSAARSDAHGASTQAALTVLDLAYGRYRQALARAQDVYRQDPPDYGTQVLPDLVEAAARTGDAALAAAALDRLALRASVVRTPLALGFLTRARALLADDSEVDGLYREAAERLERTVAVPHVARTHLLHGEWLRRRRRRRDARHHLWTAVEMFEAMGMEGFAQRARVELRATGERVSQGGGDPDGQLTPQESQIAQLVSDGLANREIAAQLYLSPNTVEYHLQKVFRKLNVTSRTQLARALLTGAVPGHL